MIKKKYRFHQISKKAESSTSSKNFKINRILKTYQEGKKGVQIKNYITIQKTDKNSSRTS